MSCKVRELFDWALHWEFAWWTEDVKVLSDSFSNYVEGSILIEECLWLLVIIIIDLLFESVSVILYSLGDCSWSVWEDWWDRLKVQSSVKPNWGYFEAHWTNEWGLGWPISSIYRAYIVTLPLSRAWDWVYHCSELWALQSVLRLMNFVFGHKLMVQGWLDDWAFAVFPWVMRDHWVEVGWTAIELTDLLDMSLCLLSLMLHSKIIVLRDKLRNAAKWFVFGWGILVHYIAHGFENFSTLFFEVACLIVGINRSFLAHSFSVWFLFVGWLIENHQVLVRRKLVLVVKSHVAHQHQILSLGTSLLLPWIRLRWSQTSVFFQK